MLVTVLGAMTKCLTKELKASLGSQTESRAHFGKSTVAEWQRLEEVAHIISPGGKER